MNYLPPFELIKGHVQISGRGRDRKVAATYEALQQMIRALLCGVQVDEAWYLREYDDVAQGIREGTITSARQHFLDHGYFEGRRPFPIAVDERWYLSSNQDVAEEVRRGVFPSGQAHFDDSGYREGRQPFPM